MASSSSCQHSWMIPLRQGYWPCLHTCAPGPKYEREPICSSFMPDALAVPVNLADGVKRWRRMRAGIS